MYLRIPSLFFIGLLVLYVSVLTSCSSKTEAHTVEIKLPTLQCSSCSKIVTRALKSVKGVKEAKVNLGEKSARVIYFPDQTNIFEMTQAVSLAGYNANETQADSKAYSGLPDCCKISSAK